MSVLKPSDLSKEKGHFESQRQYKARVFWIVLSITRELLTGNLSWTRYYSCLEAIGTFQLSYQLIDSEEFI